MKRKSRSIHKLRTLSPQIKIAGAVIILFVLPLTILAARYQQTTQEHAQINIIKNPPQVCNVKVTITEPNACPRLSTWPACTIANPNQKNNLSTYSTHLHVDTMDGQPHKVSLEYFASVCQKGYGDSANQCSCFVNSPTTAKFLNITTPYDFDITRSSGQGACGTYQYDVFINSVDGNNSCQWGNTATAGGAGYCETGTDCPNPVPTTTPDPTQNAVNIKSNGYVSLNTTPLQAGGTIGWNNIDTVSHTVTSVSGPETWDSGTLKPNQGYARTFITPGHYTYRDIYSSFTGSFDVATASSTPTATPTPTPPQGCSYQIVCPTCQPGVQCPNICGYKLVCPSTTLSPSPTPAISPTISPVTSGNTSLFMSVFLHGIGFGGDNANPNSGGNSNPKHEIRQFSVVIYNTTNQIAGTKQGSLSYDFTTGNFTGNIDLGNLPSGTYTMTVKTDGFLRKLLPGIQTITTGQVNPSPEVFLVNGDVNNDNQLDLLDYNIIIGCFGSKATTPSCTNKLAADINDDGLNDGVDYNLFLRELSVQPGDGNPSPTPPQVSPTPVLSISPTPTLSLPTSTPTPTRSPNSTPTPTSSPGDAKNKIKHIVIIMLENRSFDHYFGTYPGAEGFPSSYCNLNPATGHCVKPFHLSADVNTGGPHGAQDSTNAVNGGKMDGFVQAVCGNKQHPGCSTDTPDIMGYKDATELPNYWAWAQNFVLQDHLFEGVASWSHPSHMSWVSEWSAQCSSSDPNSCQSSLNLNGVYSNHAWTDMTYLFHKNNISWSYYLDGGQQVPVIWNPLPGFNDVTQDGQQNNVQDMTNFFTAAKAGNLPAVSWVQPNRVHSDHTPDTTSSAQAFATSVVNAVMQSPNWASSAIFLTWDDWGGFFDHVNPPKIDVNGYGIRVPGLLISPYAKKGFIDKQVLSWDAYNKFIEDVFLNGQRLDPKTDGRPDSRPTVRDAVTQLGDLTQEFDFTQSPRPPMLLAAQPPFRIVAAGEIKPKETILQQLWHWLRTFF